MRKLSLLSVCLLLCSCVGMNASFHPVPYEQLPGWSQQLHGQALRAFQLSCETNKTPSKVAGYRIDKHAYERACQAAENTTNARIFFETHFQPLTVSTTGQLTGYFAPELNGSTTKTSRFNIPIYGIPKASERSLSRAAIETKKLSSRAIAYTDDPVALFFMHVQGSGWLTLQDGTHHKLAFAGHNNHSYQSIGKLMVQRDIFASASTVSADAIKAWLYQNPKEGEALMRENPRYIFFSLQYDRSAVVGAEGSPLTAKHSIAIDPTYTSYGTPIWLQGTWPDGKPLNLLTIAQDTGSAIKGRTRADLFIGSGESAGFVAGGMRNPVQFTILAPK